MAHKKAGGSSRNGRDSGGQRLGVKLFGGEACVAGNIIVRQRGTKWHPGTNVGLGKDHTLFAKVNGHVSFNVTGKGRTYVSVLPMMDQSSVVVASSCVKAPRRRSATGSAQKIGARATPPRRCVR